MTTRGIAVIGLGEAGLALAGGLAGARGYDRLLDTPDCRARIEQAASLARIDAAVSCAEAVSGAKLILCLVTADQSLVAAQAIAAAMSPQALFCDMNSVASATKRAAASIIEAGGGRYVDVAVMAPVEPVRRKVPLLLAGPHADAAATELRDAGFENVRALNGAVGAASAIKMIRSVMIKGVESLSAECAIAAQAAGVLDEVLASLDASWPGADWRRRFDYNLDRMMVHGSRRASEMEEAAATLSPLGVDPAMTRGTVERQRGLGRLGIAPPSGLDVKLDVLAPFTVTVEKADAA